jgi:hypothetical protein
MNIREECRDLAGLEVWTLLEQVSAPIGWAEDKEKRPPVRVSAVQRTVSQR